MSAPLPPDPRFLTGLRLLAQPDVDVAADHAVERGAGQPVQAIVRGVPAQRRADAAKALGEGGTENDEAQVERQRRDHDEPQGYAGHDQRQRAKLGGAGLWAEVTRRG